MDDDDGENKSKWMWIYIYMFRPGGSASHVGAFSYSAAANALLQDGKKGWIQSCRVFFSASSLACFWWKEERTRKVNDQESQSRQERSHRVRTWLLLLLTQLLLQDHHYFSYPCLQYCRIIAFLQKTTKQWLEEKRKWHIVLWLASRFFYFITFRKWRRADRDCKAIAETVAESAVQKPNGKVWVYIMRCGKDDK